MDNALKECVLDKLYTSISDVENCEPRINIDDLTVTASELQTAIAKHVSYVRSLKKIFNVTDDTRIRQDQVTNVIKCTLKLPRVIGPKGFRVIECVIVEKFKDVKFQHSCVNNDGTIKPAMFAINVPECDPNSVQCLNTGYIMNVPREVNRRYAYDNKLQIDEEKSEEIIDFVIMPQILSQNKHIKFAN